MRLNSVLKAETKKLINFKKKKNTSEENPELSLSLTMV
jgi:hypothetical protein